jgi:cell division protein FtsW
MPTRSHIDWMLFLSVAALMLFSVAFVYSASAYFADVKFGSSEKLFLTHTTRVMVGFVLIIIFAKIDYHIWQKYSKPILLIGIGALVFVLVGGTVIKGARRWINIGFLGFQPSELAKFALVLHLAAMLAEKKLYIKDLHRTFVPMMFWIGAVCVLIALQPNFSTASVIFGISMMLMFIGNVNVLYLLGTIAAGVAGGSVYALMKEYRIKRLMAFPEQMRSIFDETAWRGMNYQLQQAILAFGNGGAFGVGPGQSRQRDWFLPESYGDFIFSIIGEEYGYVGILMIIAAFGVIIWRGFKIARAAQDDFGRYLAAGITLTFTVYAIINMGVTSGLLPTTGLPLPFISYGGTAILFYTVALGVLLNISTQTVLTPLQSPAVSVVPAQKKSLNPFAQAVR